MQRPINHDLVRQIQIRFRDLPGSNVERYRVLRREFGYAISTLEQIVSGRHEAGWRKP